MNRRRLHFAPALSVVNEVLEKRVVLSAATLHLAAAEITAQTARPVATQTTLAANTGTLSQPITFTVTVRAPAAAGTPQGTVNIVDHGSVLTTLTLSPTASTNARFASSGASVTLHPEPGGSAYYFGRHAISATFNPSGSFRKSTAKTMLTVSQPAYTTLAGGVKTATIAPGTGPQIQSGQTASVLYTGYLERNGKIFDDSLVHGGAPFSFALGAGAVIPGFDAGTVGMQVGETRIVLIPPAEGYGSTATGQIPRNSTLIFVLTLESIS